MVNLSNEDLSFILGITFIILAIICVIAIVSYVLMAIPLYKMAKKTVPDKAFLAWIPYGNLFLMAYIPASPFSALGGKVYIEDRNKVATIFLLYTLVGATALAIINNILSFIPILGPIVALFIYLAFYVVTYIFTFYIRRDLLDTFSPGNNTAITIIGLFVPLVFIIFLYIRASEDPVEYAAADRRI